MTPDGRAEIEIYSLPNTAHYTPRSYLAAKMKIEPATLHYKRVTRGLLCVVSCQGRKDLLYPVQFFRRWCGDDPLRLSGLSAIGKT